MSETIEWVSVNDRLPEPNVKVLFIDYSGVCVGHWDGKAWWQGFFEDPATPIWWAYAPTGPASEVK